MSRCIREALSNQNFGPEASETVLQGAVCSSLRTEQASPCFQSISGKSENNSTIRIVEDSSDNTMVNICGVANQLSSKDHPSSSGTNAPEKMKIVKSCSVPLLKWMKQKISAQFP